MTKVILLLVTCLSFSGCSRLRLKIQGPDVPPLILNRDDLNDLRDQIACARVLTAAGGQDAANSSSSGETCANSRKRKGSTPQPQPIARQTFTKEDRNDIQQRLVTASDMRYLKLRNNLLTSRNGLTFGAEVTGTTLSAVAALVGGSAVISTASSLVQSTNVALQKDFFQEQTTVALVNIMDAQRAIAKSSIDTGETLELSAYGLEKSLNDALHYDDAGTVHTALLNLTAASQKAKADVTCVKDGGAKRLAPCQ